MAQHLANSSPDFESTESSAPQVTQLRLVVQVDDFDAAFRFYHDALGLPVEEAYDGANQERVVILGAGRATLELANVAQKHMIDEVEVGRQVSPRMRAAFEVGDAADVTRRLTSAGATLVAEPTRTPWDSLNARFDGPGPLHLTVFQELHSDTAAENHAPNQS